MLRRILVINIALMKAGQVGDHWPYRRVVDQRVDQVVGRNSPRNNILRNKSSAVNSIIFRNRVLVRVFDQFE